MGIESKGRRLLFCGYSTGCCCDPENPKPCKHVPDVGESECQEGVFYTLPQLAEIEASHAKELKSARGEGAFKIIDGLILDGVISVGRGAELMEMGLLDFREYARTHAKRPEVSDGSE